LAGDFGLLGESFLFGALKENQNDYRNAQRPQKQSICICYSLAVFHVHATLLCSPIYGQLTGIKSIPGSYASITAAVTALNAQSVGPRQGDF
jgi:phosphatidylserine decarboxylase